MNEGALDSSWGHRMSETLGWGQGQKGQSGAPEESDLPGAALRQSSTFLSAQHQPPYNLKAFNLRIDFSKEYPFKPPTVKFTTKIYHPNVGESGEVCVPLLSKENWNPYIKICQGGLGLAQRRDWSGWRLLDLS